MIPMLIQLKKDYPCLKVIPSVGGWSLSGNLFYLIKDGTPKDYERFAKKAVATSRALGMDGLDIDYEWNTSDDTVCKRTSGYIGHPFAGERYTGWGRKYVELLEAIKKEQNENETLSIALQMNEDYIGDLSEVGHRFYNVLDWLGCMSYDYNGAWASFSAHNAPLFPHKDDPNYGKDWTVQQTIDKLASIVKPKGTTGRDYSKLVLGIAYYGRVFRSSKMFGKATGAGTIKSWESGVMDYDNGGVAKDIRSLPEAKNPKRIKVTVDGITSQDPYIEKEGHVIVYDDELSIQQKCKWGYAKGMMGWMAWEADGDRSFILSRKASEVFKVKLGDHDCKVLLPDGSSNISCGVRADLQDFKTGLKGCDSSTTEGCAFGAGYCGKIFSKEHGGWDGIYNADDMAKQRAITIPSEEEIRSGKHIFCGKSKDFDGNVIEGRPLKIDAKEGKKITVCIPPQKCKAENCPPMVGKCNPAYDDKIISGDDLVKRDLSGKVIEVAGCQYSKDYKGLNTLPEAWYTNYCAIAKGKPHEWVENEVGELAMKGDTDGYGLQCAGFAGNQMKYLKEVSKNLKNSGWIICDSSQIGSPDCVRLGFMAPPPIMVGNNSRNVKPGKEPWGRGTTGASGMVYYVEKIGKDGKPRKAVLVNQDRCAGYCYQKEGQGCVTPSEKDKQYSLGWDHTPEKKA